MPNGLIYSTTLECQGLWKLFEEKMWAKTPRLTYQKNETTSCGGAIHALFGWRRRMLPFSQNIQSAGGR